jgi:hypothetical protein
MATCTALAIDQTSCADRASAEVPDRSGAATILISRGFLLATAILLLNDWILKPVVNSWWTGKLSDVHVHATRSALLVAVGSIGAGASMYCTVSDVTTAHLRAAGGAG